MANILVGRVVQRIDLASDQQAIRFTLESGEEIVARCYGDCCSETWIEDLINPEFVLGSPVLEVTDLELPTQAATKFADHYEDQMQYYGVAIRTAKGVMTIAYRNSSNGYYGGSLDWPEGGVHGQNKSTQEWVEVKVEAS